MAKHTGILRPVNSEIECIPAHPWSHTLRSAYMRRTTNVQIQQGCFLEYSRHSLMCLHRVKESPPPPTHTHPPSHFGSQA